MAKHCFNILTFNHPSDSLTFYFSDKEEEGTTRIFHELVPDEVIDKYGEQEHYYTSFCQEKEGFIPVTKPTIPTYEKITTEERTEKSVQISKSALSSSILKRYYNSLIHNHFKSKGCLVKPNFVSDTEVWLPSDTQDKEGIYKTFDRFSLKVQFRTVSNSLELLVTFEGKSKIFKTPVSELFEEVPVRAFNWVLYEKGLHRFECFQKDQTKELAGSILRAVKDYVNVNSGIRRLVIHFYKDMSREEVEPIENGLKELDLNIPVFIVTINKTESSDIVAFDLDWKALMPVSGTFIKLGYNRFLLFNNTRYSASEFNFNDGFSFPVKLKINCSNPELVDDYKTVKELIDQVYQFSRMYWKSVRQQNLPVTIKYPEMVAEMLPYFEGNEIPDYGKDNLWFL